MSDKPPLKVSDLEFVKIAVKAHKFDRRFSLHLNALSATDEQFSEWLKRRANITTDDRKDKTKWTISDRLKACDDLWQAGSLIVYIE